jgi:hypothetical protein
MAKENIKAYLMMRNDCHCAACNMRRLRENADKKPYVLSKEEIEIMRQALKKSVKDATMQSQAHRTNKQ